MAYNDNLMSKSSCRQRALLIVVAQNRHERVDPASWMRSLERAVVVDSEPDDLGVVVDGSGVYHPVKDDGIDHRTRSRVHRFELRDAGGLTADVIHATMVEDGFHRKGIKELEGAVRFIDLSLAAKWVQVDGGTDAGQDPSVSPRRPTSRPRIPS